MEDIIQQKFDKLNRQIFMLLRKGALTLDKHNEEELERLLQHSIRLEEYETSALIKREIDKRKRSLK